MRKFLLLFNLTILFTLLLLNPLIAQTGKIAGRVTDASTGEALPFVNIVIVGTTYGAASDIDGYYFLINLPPGIYSVKASAIGYTSIEVQEVKVASGFTTTEDFKLQSTTLELGEEIIVIAEKPLIQKDLTASTSIIGEDVISQLPVANINDILQLQAGIVKSGADFHVRGGRKGQVVYQIDGVAVTDAYDGSTVIDVNSNAVQELQVISGAFNAEYGQAMSGVINIVTKDGDNDLSGNFQTYTGDYLSNRTDKFWDIDDFDPIAIRNFEGSLSGPIIQDKLFFFLNGRYTYNSGYLYGRRTFLVTDIATEVQGSGGNEFDITQSGDNSFVSMNPREKIYGQGKLTYRLLSNMKVNFNYAIDKEEYKDFNHDRKLTPDNNLNRFRIGYSNILTINHAISNSSFYTINLSYFYKQYEHYLFDEKILDGPPYNPISNPYGYSIGKYVNNYIRQTPPYSFEIGGTDLSRFKRSTGTYAVGFDWTSQLNQEINLQFGGSFKRHQIFYKDITLEPITIDGVDYVYVPPIQTTHNNQYTHNPLEGAFYVQSKLEAFNLIFNIGARVDVFDPDGKVLSNPRDPNINNPLIPENQAHTFEERQTYWYNDASVKYQISPRIGLAFPITANGVIHFSYGHFFQLPPYEYLYTNPEFELGVGSGNQGLFGNADLKPQKTVKGEIGLQQQIGDDIAVDVTVFFEDFRNLTGTQTEEVLVFGSAQSYSRYANSDFGFSKGFIISFEKRFSAGLSASIDYTYSVTKGNASDPADIRESILDGALAETFIAPLNWDQSHTLNLSVAYNVERNFGFSLIGNFFTGQPFTPAVNKNTRVTQNAFPRNSENKPTVFNIDLRVNKDFEIGNTLLTLFLRVYNLLDLDNSINVYDNSGQPLFTFDQLEANRIREAERIINPNAIYYNSIEEYYLNSGFFSAPRRVEFGLNYNF